MVEHEHDYSISEPEPVELEGDNVAGAYIKGCVCGKRKLFVHIVEKIQLISEPQVNPHDRTEEH